MSRDAARLGARATRAILAKHWVLSEDNGVRGLACGRRLKPSLRAQAHATPGVEVGEAHSAVFGGCGLIRPGCARMDRLAIGPQVGQPAPQRILDLGAGLSHGPK
jgi:hypothetical protein